MLGFKQFRQEGCLSYFLYDSETRELAVVDPRADLMQDYRSYIIENGLKPAIVFETRVHTHHASGASFFADEYKARIADRALLAGQVVSVGALRIEVLKTPGISYDAISLRVGGLVLTGDTLWIDAPARLDHPGADDKAHRASVQEVLGVLPDLSVFPGHERGDVLFSTLSIEKKKNPDFLPPSREARSNSRADIRRAASINVEKLLHKVKERAEGVCFLDVRETEEFKQGHLPGALNIPLSLLAFHLKDLRMFRRIYVSCESGRRSVLAVHTLDYLGFPDVVNVSGGFRAWKSAGFAK